MQAGHEELPGGFHGLTNNCRCFWLSATLPSAAKESQFTVRRTPRVFPLRTYNNVRSYSWSSWVIDCRFFFFCIFRQVSGMSSMSKFPRRTKLPTGHKGKSPQDSRGNPTVFNRCYRFQLYFVLLPLQLLLSRLKVSYQHPEIQG